MRYRLFFFLAAALVALGIGGCGGEGKSSDPLGTDSLTFGDSSGSAVLQLDPNGAVQLTAKVKDAAGKEVADREVSFEFVTNASGATLTSTKVNTNAAGEATILYRAGAAVRIRCRPGLHIQRGQDGREHHRRRRRRRSADIPRRGAHVPGGGTEQHPHGDGDEQRGKPP